MLEPSFDYLPTVELLDYLVPGVLGQKGNLLKAVRLWVNELLSAALLS